VNVDVPLFDNEVHDIEAIDDEPLVLKAPVIALLV